MYINNRRFSFKNVLELIADLLEYLRKKLSDSKKDFIKIIIISNPKTVKIYYYHRRI